MTTKEVRFVDNSTSVGGSRGGAIHFVRHESAWSCYCPPVPTISITTIEEIKHSVIARGTIYFMESCDPEETDSRIVISPARCPCLLHA